jgi:hypothetical protein
MKGKWTKMLGLHFPSRLGPQSTTLYLYCLNKNTSKDKGIYNNVQQREGMQFPKGLNLVTNVQTTIYKYTSNGGSSLVLEYLGRAPRSLLPA